jgi:putative Holliday junction resolvase
MAGLRLSAVSERAAEELPNAMSALRVPADYEPSGRGRCRVPGKPKMLETRGAQSHADRQTQPPRFPGTRQRSRPRLRRPMSENFRRGARLAFDWGDARIGVAACDPDGVLAYPVKAVRAGEYEIADLAAVIEEYEPIEVIVGLPRSLSGGEGPAAVKARERAEALARAIRVPVRLVDERLTTLTASQRLREGGKRAKEQRELIDAAAAVAILEQALALEQSAGNPPGELVSAPGGPATEGPDLPGGSGQERPLQT